MQVAVVGGGVIGVCSAYYLAQSGHDVTVFERQGNVAEQTSFGSAGVHAPGYAIPWAMPGAVRLIFSQFFKSEKPVLIKSKIQPALWRWLRKWSRECELNRFRINQQRMQRLALYSNQLLAELIKQHQLDFEQTQGYLHLLRTESEQTMMAPLLTLMQESGSTAKVIEASAARELEPGLAPEAALIAAIQFSGAAAGNCPLFTKQLKHIASQMGVRFVFGSHVRSVQTLGRRPSVQLDNDDIAFDAIVLATGVDSPELLTPLGIRLPLYPVKGYSVTASIKHFEEAPRAALMDDRYKVSIVRMGNRIRLAGLAELGAANNELDATAIRTLLKVGDDWFPHAANYHSASFWCGKRATLPDGNPVIGATAVPGVFVNLGHGSAGWAMAAGSGKLVADLIAGRPAEIDADGLTVTRFTR